jgi:hypothetical protein
VIGWADTTASGQPWYLFNNSPPAGFNPTGTIQYIDGRIAGNGIGPNTFPGLTIPSPDQYGVTDIGYQFAATAIPEPASLTMLGLGAVGMMAYGWRRRRQQAA